MLESILEPILLGSKSDQDSRRPAVASDEDLFVLGESEVLGQVILDRRQRYRPRDRACLLRRATLARRLS